VIKRSDSGVRKDPGGAVALAIVLLAFISLEAIYLDDAWKRGEEARRANDQLEAGNTQMQRHMRNCGQLLRRSAQCLRD
jgi:hypothetical protein